MMAGIDQLLYGYDPSSQPLFQQDQPQPKSLLERILTETWPAKMAQAAYNAVKLPGDVYSGAVPVTDDSGRTSPDVINRSADLAALMQMGSLPLAANISKPGEVTLGIVPVDAGKAFGIKPNLPNNDIFKSAVSNTPGARIEDGSLVLPVMRQQKPEQAMAESVRGGVFYLPEGSDAARYYTGRGMNFTYGGSDKIAGETAINNPLFVKGATGGKAPEAAFDALLGKGAYQQMRTDALRSTGPYYLSGGDKAELARQFLEKYAPEMQDLADYVVQSSGKGNQLPYALQEAAVASAARRAGHDAVVGYSLKRGPDKQPFISEVFDTRESHYPNTQGNYQTWPLPMFNGGQQ